MIFLEQYPDTTDTFGFHTICVTLQHGSWTADFSFHVYGNLRGAGLLPFSFRSSDASFFRSDTIQFHAVEGCEDLIDVTFLKDAPKDLGEGESGHYYPVKELDAMVVKTEIISFREDEGSGCFLATDDGQRVQLADYSEAFPKADARQKARYLFHSACGYWWWALKNYIHQML